MLFWCQLLVGLIELQYPYHLNLLSYQVYSDLTNGPGTPNVFIFKENNNCYIPAVLHVEENKDLQILNSMPPLFSLEVPVVHPQWDQVLEYHEDRKHSILKNTPSRSSTTKCILVRTLPPYISNFRLLLLQFLLKSLILVLKLFKINNLLSRVQRLPQTARVLTQIHWQISYKIHHRFHPISHPSQKRTAQCQAHLCNTQLLAANRAQLFV